MHASDTLAALAIRYSTTVFYPILHAMLDYLKESQKVLVSCSTVEGQEPCLAHTCVLHVDCQSMYTYIPHQLLIAQLLIAQLYKLKLHMHKDSEGDSFHLERCRCITSKWRISLAMTTHCMPRKSFTSQPPQQTAAAAEDVVPWVTHLMY